MAQLAPSRSFRLKPIQIVLLSVLAPVAGCTAATESGVSALDPRQSDLDLDVDRNERVLFPGNEVLLRFEENSRKEVALETETPDTFVRIYTYDNVECPSPEHFTAQLLIRGPCDDEGDCGSYFVESRSTSIDNPQDCGDASIVTTLRERGSYRIDVWNRVFAPGTVTLGVCRIDTDGSDRCLEEAIPGDQNECVYLGQPCGEGGVCQPVSDPNCGIPEGCGDEQEWLCAVF